MTRPETRYARSGDVHVAFQVHGTGPVDLVFVPGFVSNVDQQWESPASARLFNRLGDVARVIRFDKRGTGLSDMVATIPTLEQRMDDLRAVMDAAHSESAVVFGMSEGGSMSALFAATHPARVRALVLYGAYAAYAAYVLSGARLAAYLADIEAGWGTGVTLRWLAPRQAEDPALRASWARLEQHGASPHAALQVVRMNAEIDIRDILPAIRVPTLVLHRRDDMRVPLAAGRFLADTIPDARLVVLPGDAHPAQIGDGDRIAEEIVGFVTGSQPRPPPAPGTRLASILAADLADGPRAAASAGDEAWAARMHGFRDAAGAIVAQFGGMALGPSIGADGSALALFDGPARAVRCGAELRGAAERLLGTRLRLGVHVGEVAVDERGTTASGLAVLIARRVAALAGSGEILVTGTVRDLAAGAGLRFRKRELRLPLGETNGARLALLAYAGDDRDAPEPPPREPTALADLSGLSAREREVLRLMAQGRSNPAIAAQLSLSEHTAKRHVANVLLKLGLPTRAAAAAFAARAGLL